MAVIPEAMTRIRGPTGVPPNSETLPVSATNPSSTTDPTHNRIVFRVRASMLAASDFRIVLLTAQATAASRAMQAPIMVRQLRVKGFLPGRNLGCPSGEGQSCLPEAIGWEI
jgi:hypothetical protein